MLSVNGKALLRAPQEKIGVRHVKRRTPSVVEKWFTA